MPSNVWSGLESCALRSELILFEHPPNQLLGEAWNACATTGTVHLSKVTHAYMHMRAQNRHFAWQANAPLFWAIEPQSVESALVLLPETGFISWVIYIILNR